MQDQIRYVKRKDIDTQKWNECIRNAPAAIIYVYSYYLDAIADQWDALIKNDYEAVLPLTWKEKYGIKYIYQPFFMAQTGVFGQNITETILNDFIDAIPLEFKYVDIDLHETNFSEAVTIFSSARTNMILSLDQAYDSLHEKYHRLAKRMIRKSLDAGLQVDEVTGIEETISFYSNIYEPRVKIGKEAYRRLSGMLTIAQSKNELITLAARYHGNIVGIYNLMMDDRNVYSVVGGSSEEGKENGAFYFLTDFALKKTCDSKRTFRFEGSDKKEIAFFNQQFGAKAIDYPHLKKNRLPILLRWLKR